MANVMANIGRSRLRAAKTGASDLIIILLKTAEADDTLRDYDTLSALLAAGGGTANVEADFTNYSRKVIANASWTFTDDDTNNRSDADFPDQTYTAAGGATNNTLVKAIVCIDGANDGARIPVTIHDFTPITDGSDLVLQVAAAGFYRSSD